MRERKPEPVRVSMLGGFRVAIGSRTIGQNEWRLKKAAALVKLLALAPDHRLHREQMMDTLWPHLGKKAASNNLRRTLHTARRVLDPADGSRYLASEDKMARAVPRRGALGGCRGLRGGGGDGPPRARARSLPGGARPLRGELLPTDRYEGWTEEKRGELRRILSGPAVGARRACTRSGVSTSRRSKR